MPRLRVPQNTMSSGELDPLLAKRFDVKHYYNGLEKARNVFLLPQGGARRRFGQEFVDELAKQLSQVDTSGATVTAPNGGTAANADDGDVSTVVLTTANISTTNPYVIVHVDFGSATSVDLVDIRDLKLTASSLDDEVFVQYSTDNSNWTSLGTAIDVTTSETTRRRGRPGTTISARYWRLARVGATDMSTAKFSVGEIVFWTMGATLSAARCISFTVSTVQRYMLVASDRNVDVFKDGTYQASVWIPHTSAQLAGINWVQSLDTLLIFHEDVQVHKLFRMGSDVEWDSRPQTLSNIPTYDFGDGAEAVLSSTRGWPRCGTFHEGRLFLAGSAQRPQTVWASKVGSFFDLDQGTAQADEGLEFTLDTDDVASIYNIRSARHLQVFTSSAEFYILPNTDAITPSNIIAKRTTQIGSKGPGIRTASVEGATLFFQREGNALREFLFTDTEAAYASANISLLSSHLISTPTDMALRPSTSTEEGDLVLAVNSGDGTMVVLQTLRSQQITGFSLLSTDGTYLAVGVDLTDIYVVVERTINAATVRFIERLVDGRYMDAGVYYDTTGILPTDTLTGLDHLEGHTVHIRADGSDLGTAVVASGQITLSRNAAETAEVGLEFPDVKGDGNGDQIWIRDMPLEPNLPDGTRVGKMKRVHEVVVSLSSTQNVYVGANDEDLEVVPLRSMGSNLLNQPPPTVTADKIVEGLPGYTLTGQVDITQRHASPFTLLAITKEARVS